MTTIGWIGLGVMGAPMAAHLKTRGRHDVRVYNRSPDKAERWVKDNGGDVAKTPAQAADGADMVIACVGNDDDVRAVTTGADGAFGTMAPGALFIDHTTTSAELARDLAAEAASRNLGFLDAPVSGGQAGAEAGALTIMIGGTTAAFGQAEPVLKAYARTIRHIGPTGAGQLAKMVNQIAVAGVVQGLAEALHFGERAGLDIAAVIDAISQGAAQSWQMNNRWQTMHARDFDFGFAVDWMRKDLGICFEEAGRNGAELPTTRLIDTYYAEIQAMGGRRWDTSSLIARFAKPDNDA